MLLNKKEDILSTILEEIRQGKKVYSLPEHTFMQEQVGKKALIAEVKRMPENNYVHSTFMEKVEHLRHKEMAKYDIETRVLGLEDM